MTSSTFHPLIDAARLLTLIQNPNLRLFDCRFSLAEPGLGRRRYAEGHLPGAQYADLDEHLSAPIGPETGRHPLPDAERLARWLGSCGVGQESLVVLYDDVRGALAGRLWWLLRWLGHERVALLDGGMQAWTAAGGTLTTEVPASAARDFHAHPNADAWITTDALSAALAAAAVRILDARPPERFRGEVEPLDPVAGHIPGACNLPQGENLDADGRFLPPERLRARFLAALDGWEPSEIIHSCGSGVTACHNLLAMEAAGLRGSRLYVGSWSEWIRDPSRPTARGGDGAHGA